MAIDMISAGKLETSMQQVLCTKSCCILGMDTTGSALAFMIYNLAVNPEKQDLLRCELSQLSNDFGADDLDKLKYLKACIKENFRCFPISHTNLRVLGNNYIRIAETKSHKNLTNISDTKMTLSGYRLPRKTAVLFSNEILARDPRFFPDPEKFQPERWINPETRRNIHPFSVRPFGHGKRICIGKR